jgi:hypothetical protein
MAGEKPTSRYVVVRIDLEVVGLEGNGDVFSVVLRSKGREHEPIVDLPGQSLILRKASIGFDGHRQTPRQFLSSESVVFHCFTLLLLTKKLSEPNAK